MVIVMSGLDYQKANAIENTLALARTLLPEMQAAYRPSGTFSPSIAQFIAATG